MKDWGESVSELMIVKNNYKKLYRVSSCLGVFTFCTCKILICLACIVASLKLFLCNCWLAVCIVVVILCVFVVVCVHFYFRCQTAG